MVKISVFLKFFKQKQDARWHQYFSNAVAYLFQIHDIMKPLNNWKSKKVLKLTWEIYNEIIGFVWEWTFLSFDEPSQIPWNVSAFRLWNLSLYFESINLWIQKSVYSSNHDDILKIIFSHFTSIFKINKYSKFTLN